MAPLNSTTNTKLPNQSNSSRTPMPKPSPSKTPSVNGIGRSPSLRGGLSRPGRGGARASPQTSFLNTNTTASDDVSDDDARAERASLMDELRSRVQKAETASEEYQRQLNLLQARLDESQQSHGQLEDQLNESTVKVEDLEAETVQAARQKRDLENIFKSERATLIKEKTEQTAREEELQTTIKRLKENLSQRESRNSVEDGKNMSRTSSGQFAPPSSVQRRDSEGVSELVGQKDRVIKSLRLELADAQIKIMEMDTTGGGQVQELERKLMEAKITNARLTEDNESFQLLLSEKTLNGDFSKTEAMQTSSGPGSLAEELGTEELESAEGKSEDTRRLEVEVKSLKDQNKALALYIENIIGRLLSHKEFENILDKTPDLMSGAPRPMTANTDKELPPPPPSKDDEPDTVAGTLLARARSVVSGPNKPRPRPTSHLPPPPSEIDSIETANSDPTTAPRIPIARSQSVRPDPHSRSNSDMPTGPALVNHMYRGPPSSGSVAPMLSPVISPGVGAAARTSFFSPQAPATTPSSLGAGTVSPNTTPRAPSGSRSPGFDRTTTSGNPGSSSNSTFSDHSGGGVDGSPPRNSMQNNYTGAVMTQNRLRPLRLVQENPDAGRDEVVARKKANRASWMPSGWNWAGGKE